MENSWLENLSHRRRACAKIDIKKKRKKKEIKKKRLRQIHTKISDRKTGKLREKNIVSMSNASATFGDAMNEKCITTNKYLHVADKERNFIDREIYIFFE